MRWAIALLCAVLLSGQDARFNSQSRLVVVPTTVTDSKGKSIDGLERPDFLILDNGKPQTAGVDVLGTGVAPIALVIAVQSSGISQAALEKVRKIGGMIQPLVTGERGCAALLTFDARVQWVQDCTSDEDKLLAAFGRLHSGDEKTGRMLDAAQAAITRLQARPNSRRVLLLISESRDRGSETDLDAVVMSAQKADVTVYAATYSAMKTAFTAKPSEIDSPTPPQVATPPPIDPSGPPGRERIPIQPMANRVDILGGLGELGRLGKTKTTEVLTAQTGGTTFPFTKLEGLQGAIEKLGDELQSQYLLSFMPQSPTPGLHRLEVRVVNNKKARIRARSGYWVADAVPVSALPDHP